MRFKDMIAAREGVDRPALKPKPYADDTVRIGDKVHCTWEGHRGKHGRVLRELIVKTSVGDVECWVVGINKADKYGHKWVDEEIFNKCYCERIRPSQVSKLAREVIKQQYPYVPEKIYGDGDLD